MTTLDGIIHWAQNDLPAWQSDAVRRFLSQGSITESDKRELLLMLKASYGLNDPKIAIPTATPVSASTVSGASKTATSVVLKAIEGLKNVNAIPNDAALRFGHQGLTVVYGENGAGKSGYARVLKRACRARDTNERLLPNVFGSAVSEPAEASFKISVNGAPDQSIKWQDGQSGDPILANIAVFDSKCARIIVDEKNQAQYLPYGADVFESLVHLLEWLRLRLNVEKPTPTAVKADDITSVTKVGVFLASLSHDTDMKQFEEMTKWGAEHEKKLEKITRQIIDIEINDPVKKARSTRSLKERVIKLRDAVQQNGDALSEDKFTAARTLIIARNEAKKALELASKMSLNDEPLPGGGDTAWQSLFNAAKEYAATVAYPGKPFPFTGESSRCVLCMQPLTDEGKDRFMRFKTFMEQVAKKKHDAAAKAVAQAIEKLSGLRTPSPDLYQGIVGDIRNLNETLADAVNDYFPPMVQRVQVFQKVLSGEDINTVPDIQASPQVELSALADKLEKDAVELENSTKPEGVEKLKSEKAELSARKRFAAEKDNAAKYIKDLGIVRKYDQCLAACDTGGITRKGKAVISDALTPQLKKSVDAELKALGAQLLPLNVKPTASKGETHHQLELKGAQNLGKTNLTDILSEGEQRVVALSGFLAELALAGHSCPIVLDDPVTSLDHHYREKIAARLVTEAAKRQVLVFTHDIAFLLELQNKAGEEVGVYFASQTVAKQNGVVGVSASPLPWHAMTVKERLTVLRARLADCRSLHPYDLPHYNAKASMIYALLRESWEASVEEKLLYGTIMRHGREVKTQQLRYVGVTTEQYRQVYIGMSKCSTWMYGHDKSNALNVNRPEPSEIEQDINALSTFVKDVNNAAEALRKERDVALKPTTPAIG